MGKSAYEIHNSERDRAEKLARATLVKVAEQGLEDVGEDYESADIYFDERRTEAEREYEAFKTLAINSVETGNLSEVVKEVNTTYEEFVAVINEPITFDEEHKKHLVEQAFFKFREAVADFKAKLIDESPDTLDEGKPRDKYDAVWKRYLSKRNKEDFDPELKIEGTQNILSDQEMTEDNIEMVYARALDSMRSLERRFSKIKIDENSSGQEKLEYSILEKKLNELRQKLRKVVPSVGQYNLNPGLLDVQLESNIDIINGLINEISMGLEKTEKDSIKGAEKQDLVPETDIEESTVIGDLPSAPDNFSPSSDPVDAEPAEAVISDVKITVEDAEELKERKQELVQVARATHAEMVDMCNVASETEMSGAKKAMDEAEVIFQKIENFARTEGVQSEEEFEKFESLVQELQDYNDQLEFHLNKNEDEVSINESTIDSEEKEIKRPTKTQHTIALLLENGNHRGLKKLNGNYKSIGHIKSDITSILKNVAGYSREEAKDVSDEIFNKIDANRIPRSESERVSFYQEMIVSPVRKALSGREFIKPFSSDEIENNLQEMIDPEGEIGVAEFPKDYEELNQELAKISEAIVGFGSEVLSKVDGTLLKEVSDLLNDIEETKNSEQDQKIALTAIIPSRLRVLRKKFAELRQAVSEAEDLGSEPVPDASEVAADEVSPDLDVTAPATDGEAVPVAPDVVSGTPSPDTAPAPEPTPDDLPPVAAAPGSTVSPEDAARAERLRAVGINPDSPTHEKVGFTDERKAERKSLANETMLARLSMDKCDEAYRQALSSYHKQNIKEKITRGIKNSFNGESGPAEHLRKLRKEADEAAEQYREKLLIQIEDRRKDRVLDTVLTADSDQIKTGLQNKLIVSIDAAEQKTVLEAKEKRNETFKNELSADWPKTMATVARISKLLPKNKKARLAIGLAVASMTGATLGVLAVGAAGAGVVAASAALGGAAGAGRWGVSTALGMGAGAAVNKYEGKRVKSAGERLQILLTNSENSNTMSIAEARRAVMLANAQVDTAKIRKTAMTIGATILVAGGSRGAMAAYDILSPSGVGGGASGGNSGSGAGGGEAVPKAAMSPASAASAAENAVATVEHPEPVYNDDVMKAGNDPYFDNVTDARAPFSLSESVSVLNEDPSGTITKTVVSGIELQGLQTGSLELSSGQMLEVQKLADLTVKDILSAHPHMPNAQVERLLMDRLETKFGSEAWWQAAEINNVKIGSIEVVGVGDSVVKPGAEIIPNDDVMKSGDPVNDNINDEAYERSKDSTDKFVPNDDVMRNQMDPVNDNSNENTYAQAERIKALNYTVRPGDNVSTIFHKNLLAQFDQHKLNLPEGVTREGLSKMMYEKFPELTNAQNPKWTLTPEDWKKLGISSGNPHLIRPGEQINMAMLLDKFADPSLKIGGSGVVASAAEILNRPTANEVAFEKQIKVAQDTPWKPLTETELDAAKAQGILDGTVQTPDRTMDENLYGFKPASGEPEIYNPDSLKNVSSLQSTKYQTLIKNLFGSESNFNMAVEKNVASLENNTYGFVDKLVRSYDSPYEYLKNLDLKGIQLLEQKSPEDFALFAQDHNMKPDTIEAWFSKIDQMKAKLPNNPETKLSDLYSRSVAEDFLKIKKPSIRPIKA